MRNINKKLIGDKIIKNSSRICMSQIVMIFTRVVDLTMFKSRKIILDKLGPFLLTLAT